MKNEKDIIDLGRVARILWSKKKVFLKIWIATFILSCIWIFPEPRFYSAELKLAPEVSTEMMAGGISSIVSQFGVNLGGTGGNDAIYPILYPDLLESPAFITGIFDITVTTQDGSLTTDYYTYLSKHQKKNKLTLPFKRLMAYIRNFINGEHAQTAKAAKGHDAFRLSKQEQDVMRIIQTSIVCNVDKKTDVITISVKDQDPLICATLADSVREHLQAFIIEYRTKKVRIDLDFYQHLSDSTYQEYVQAQKDYSSFVDTHKNTTLQHYVSEGERLLNEVEIKQSTYQTMNTQLQAMKAKVQERTPSFSVLQTPLVPIKPAGPKRMLFVIGMLFFVSIISSLWLTRKEIFNL